MEKATSAKKLSKLTMWGYGAGTAMDSMPYTLFFTYFIFFMTDVAGINPAFAGTISFVAIVWQGITGPIFGYLSDNSKSPKGRRRPMIMKALVPYVVVMALMYAPVHFGETVNGIYYLITAVIMWTCYSAYKGPWDALGAELTDDYNERNNIRFATGLWAYPFNMLAQSGVIAIVGIFAVKGMEGQGWFCGVGVCSVVGLLAGLFMLKTSKGKESVDYSKLPAPENSRGILDLFKQYWSIVKVKAYRKLVVFMFVFMIGYTIPMNVITYVLAYNAGLSEGELATFWMFNTVICIVTLPLATILANKVDKKISIIIFMGIFIVFNVAFFFIGVTSMVHALVFSIGMALATTAFYGVFYSLVYDCCDVYELATGERREGGIMAVAQLAQTLGSAVASLATGWLLTAFGYTGTGVETSETLQGILSMGTIIPAVIVAVSMIFLFRYKMTQERFQQVLDAVVARKEGREVNLDEFKDLI